MSQTYSVYNPNMYQLQITRINTVLVTQATITDAQNQLITYPLVGQGSFPPGVGSIAVGATSWNSFAVYYNFNATTSNEAAAIIANANQCCKSESTFVTTGSFDMSTSIHDYKDISFGTFMALVSCQCTL